MKLLLIVLILPHTQVFYIDVGYGGRVGTDRVRKIQQQFTLLPIQSYQCSLDGDEAHFGYLSANLTKWVHISIVLHNNII